MTMVTNRRGVTRGPLALPTFARRRAQLTGMRPLLEAWLCVLLPLIAPAMIVAYLGGVYHPHPGSVDGTYSADGGFLFDLHVMWKAGHDVVTGHSPYPFVYPAPAAFLMAPFGAMPWSVAVVVFMLTQIAALVFALRLLGVRDWRCHALALAALPMASSIMIGTLSPFMALGAAAAWRYRDRRWVAATAIVAVVVTKIFLWPLVVWLVATRRIRTAVTTVGLGIATLVVSWGALGFAGLTKYPHVLGRTANIVEDESYSPLALFRLLGLSTGSARAAVLALAVLGLAAIFALARGRDGQRRSFVLALGVGLLASPIVWTHYLVVLVVAIALYRPRLGAAWLVPLVYWYLPGQQNHGSIWNFVLLGVLTALSLGLAMRPSRTRVPAPALSSP
jgi:Glycosyltransferase family 87